MRANRLPKKALENRVWSPSAFSASSEAQRAGLRLPSVRGRPACPRPNYPRLPVTRFPLGVSISGRGRTRAGRLPWRRESARPTLLEAGYSSRGRSPPASIALPAFPAAILPPPRKSPIRVTRSDGLTSHPSELEPTFEHLPEASQPAARRRSEKLPTFPPRRAAVGQVNTGTVETFGPALDFLHDSPTRSARYGLSK